MFFTCWKFYTIFKWPPNNSITYHNLLLFHFFAMVKLTVCKWYLGFGWIWCVWRYLAAAKNTYVSKIHEILLWYIYRILFYVNQRSPSNWTPTLIISNIKNRLTLKLVLIFIDDYLLFFTTEWSIHSIQSWPRSFESLQIPRAPIWARFCHRQEYARRNYSGLLVILKRSNHLSFQRIEFLTTSLIVHVLITASLKYLVSTIRGHI